MQLFHKVVPPFGTKRGQVDNEEELNREVTEKFPAAWTALAAVKNVVYNVRA